MSEAENLDLPRYQTDGKILVTDVDYRPNEAVVAGILLPSWDSEEFEVSICRVPVYGDYEPGAFYKRELPCLMSLLRNIHAPLKCIVVDGYVHLGSDYHAGLGEHLHNSLGGSIPIIGVAKTYFRDTPEQCNVYRGISKNALYVTAIGINLETAKNNILSMHGENRIPTALKLSDHSCRTAARNRST